MTTNKVCGKGKCKFTDEFCASGDCPYDTENMLKNQKKFNISEGNVKEDNTTIQRLKELLCYCADVLEEMDDKDRDIEILLEEVNEVLK